MFNSSYYPMPQGPAFQRPAYPQQMPQYTPPPAMMQDGMIQARFVSGREEAVASNVMPGSMFLFHDRAHGRVYAKLIDPQTGMPEFREYAEVQQAQQSAQYVTTEALDSFRQDIEQYVESRITALKTSKQPKAKEAADE